MRRRHSRTLGRLISEEMTLQGLKQDAVAEQLETSSRQLRRMIAGEAPIGDKLLTKLAAVLNTSKRRLERALAARDRFELDVADRDYVTDYLKWSGLALLKKLRALDHEIVATLADEKFDSNPWEAKLEDLVPVYMNHPDTWRILLNRKQKVVGYWHFDVLTPEKYDRAIRGELLDEELTSEALMPLNIPGSYDIYIAFMGVLPDYNNSIVNGFHHLVNSFLDTIDQLSDPEGESDIYIRRVCANTLSPEAKLFCERLGIPKIKKHRVEGYIFEDTMENILRNWHGRLSLSRRSRVEELLTRYSSSSRAKLAGVAGPKC